MFYGQGFLILKKKTAKEWKYYTNHSFIKKLSNNTLQKSKFINKGVITINR